jgi:cytochrome c oxidase subunit 4
MAASELSKRSYYLTCGGLLLLTLSTWGVAYLPLGPWHLFAALGFSTAKATLIVLFFMHARHGNWLTWVVIISATFWLGILFVLTLGDYLTRGLT